MAVKVELKLDLSNWKKLLKELENRPIRGGRARTLQLNAAASDLLNMLRAATPKGKYQNTGALKNAWRYSIKGRKSENKQILVENPVSYAPILEFGSVSHPISARRRPLLVFRFKTGKRNWVRTETVQHPGTRPLGFVRKTLKKFRSKYPDIAPFVVVQLGRGRYKATLRAA